MRRLLTAILLGCLACGGEQIANSARGQEVLRTEECLRCHALNPRHPSDSLADFLERPLSATRLAAAIWGHAPTIWHALEQRGGSFPVMSRQQGYDLVAWFMAAGYFEPRGSARKGEMLFNTENCSKCHSLTGAGEAPPVDKWHLVSDPVPFLFAIWGHAPLMKAAMDRKRMTWPSLSTSEMSDLLAFAANLSKPANPPDLILGDPAKGKLVFSMRDCQTCHSGETPVQPDPVAHSLTELAATFWDHAPMMMTMPPSLNSQEIANVLAYLWKAGYFQFPGNALHGKATFEAKHCNACHDPGSGKGPFGPNRPWDAGSMIAALWNHPPGVLEQARGKGIVWPRFDEVEMADLIAYMNNGKPSGWRTIKP